MTESLRTCLISQRVRIDKLLFPARRKTTSILTDGKLF